MTTTVNKHWAINELTESQKNEKETIILDSIKEGIKKRLKKHYNEDAMMNVLLSIDHIKANKVSIEAIEEDNDNEFESPKFNSDYLVFDSNKYFTQSQSWIGHIEKITTEGFTAKLTDLSNPTTYEMGEFDFDEISPEDMEFVTEGAAFYWSLGRANNYGQIEKKSIIRFQRVKAWTEDDYDRILDRADEKLKRLNFE